MELTRLSKTMSWARWYALAVGVAYAALGLAGFLFSDGGRLGVFGAGPLMNVVHLAIGGISLLTGLRSGAPQFLGWALFVALAGFTAFGVLVSATGGAQDVNSLLMLRPADNWLHGITSLGGLVIGFWPRGSAEKTT